MKRKILIMGLPGSGKTTLAKELQALLKAVWFNADEVRANVNKDLGFSEADRVEQARRMGFLCDTAVKSGNFAIADFVCPTPETREAFGALNDDCFVVWVNRISEGRFEDTNKMFIPPETCDIMVVAEGTPRQWAELIYKTLIPTFDGRSPTALMLGRYQPFHDGHKALIVEAIKRVGQVCILVRDTQGTDEKNPFHFSDVKQRIETALDEYRGRFMVALVPNITNIFYGRDVGYAIERIELDATLESVSATKVRADMGLTPKTVNK